MTEITARQLEIAKAIVNHIETKDRVPNYKTVSSGSEEARPVFAILKEIGVLAWGKRLSKTGRKMSRLMLQDGYEEKMANLEKESL